MLSFYSPRARRDLREIWLYSDERWGAEQAGDHIHQVTGLCEAIADGSHPGSNADYIGPSLRKAVVSVHVVFYREEPAP
jgi:toxin ParE1/3/4